MDKEMKAKVDEFLKTNGRRELSMDELDMVSGGFEGLYTASGSYLTGSQIIDLGRSLAETMGFDIAGPMICELFQMSPNEAKKFAKDGDASDVGKMDCLLAQMFQIYDRLENSGHSY